MEDGGEATIAELAGTWYESRGYEFRHIDIDHGYVWTKDGGATYSIEEDGTETGAVKTGLGGKLSLSIDLSGNRKAHVKVSKA